MSKISLKAGEELVKNKIITEKTLQKMQASGAVSQRKMSIKRYIKTADGKWVQPMLYFRGGKGLKNSKEMNEFQEKYNALLEEYTVTNIEENNRCFL